MSLYWSGGLPFNEAGNGITMKYWSQGVPQTRLPLTVELRAQFLAEGQAAGLIDPAILGVIAEFTGTGSAGASAIVSAIVGVVGEFLAEGTASTGYRSLLISELTDPVSNHTEQIRYIRTIVNITAILGNVVDWDANGFATVEFEAHVTDDLLVEITVTGQATVSFDGALGTVSSVSGQGQSTGEFTGIVGNVILWNADGQAQAFLDGIIGLQGFVDSTGKTHSTITSIIGQVVELTGDGKADSEIIGEIFKRPVIHNVFPQFLPVNGKKINLYVIGENFPLGCIATWTASPPVPLQTRWVNENKLVVKIPGELLQSPERMGIINVYVPQIQDLVSEGYKSQPAGGGKPVARLGDKSTGHFPFPPRVNDEASSNVFANAIGLHRKGDHWVVHCAVTCHDGRLKKGSKSVFTNSKQTGRVSDPIDCGDMVAQGSPNVFIGMEARKSWFNNPTPWKESEKTWDEI